MHRSLQQHLNDFDPNNLHSARFTAGERVLQTQLCEPSLPPVQPLWLRRLAKAFTALFITQTLLAAAPAYAQLSASPTAPSGQKPLIDAAANGVPIVLVAPPSAAGVSRNQYEQLNVAPRGLVLNNSTGPVQTQIGGWINGNLQLGLTPARIILNEVTGSNMSRLQGTIEVGGQKADIVIANPNGISCDGCGFLNVNRATLTTGTPQIGADGAITGFDVRGGTLGVGPAGLNATEQQQLDLMARGLVIEGEVWAQNLQAVIGANRVVYGTLAQIPQATAQEGQGAAPRFAIDVKDMGGMYAGQIYLVATERGLGVNSTGRMATLAGNLVLSANGDLTLKDSYATANVALASTGRVNLTGQTLADGVLRIEAPTLLMNSGAVQAPKLELATPGISNSGSIAQSAPKQDLNLALPAGLANSGAIYTPGNLGVQASSVTSGGTPTGSLLAGGALRISADTLQLTGQQLAANDAITVQARTLSASGGGMTSGGDVLLHATGGLDVSGTTIAANGQARLAGTQIALANARISAQGNINLASNGAIAASAAQIASNANLTAQGSRIDLQGGTLTATVNADLHAAMGITTAHAVIAASKIAIDAGTGALTNSGGKVQASSTAADALNVKAAGIANEDGELHANGGLTLDARGGLLANTRGVVAGTTGTLTGVTGLTNEGGLLYTQSDLNLSGMALNNAQGTIATAGKLTVNTPGQDINNTGGVLQAAGTITLDAGSAALRNAGGTVAAGADLTVTAERIDMAAGTLAAGGPLQVTTGNLNASAGKLGSGAAATLHVTGAAELNGATVSAQGKLTVSADSITAVGATAASNSDLQATAGTITGGAWSAAGNLTATAQGALSVAGGGLMAGGNVLATGLGIITDGAKVGGQSVTLNAGAGALSNVGGAINASGTGAIPAGQLLTINANGVNNSGGAIVSAADAAINANGQTVNNMGGSIQVAGVLQMQAGQLVNRGGNLTAASALTLAGFALDNNAGTIQTGGNLVIDTGGRLLDNTGGKLVAQGHASINTGAGALTGAGGTVSAAGSATVQAASLDTTGGRISGTRGLDVLVTRNLAANNAVLATDGKLTVSAAGIDAQGATLQAGESVGVSSAGAIDAANARLTALKGVSVQAAAALTLDGAVVRANEQITASGSSVAASTASFSAAGRVEIAATTGPATMNSTTVIASDTLTITAKGIAAAAAKFGAINSVTLAAGTGNFDAPGALVQSQTGGIAVTAGGAADTSNAVIISNAAIGIAAQGALNNRGGQIASTAQVTLSGTTVDNTAGLIDANGALGIAVSQGTVTNDGGRITTRDVLTMGAPGGVLTSLTNQGGTINTTGALSLNQQSFNNAGGNVTALAGLAIAGGAVNNTGGTLASKGSVTVNTAGGSFLGADSQLLAEQGAVALTAGATTLSRATVTSGAAITLAASSLDAAAVQLNAQTGLTASASTGGITATAARITAGGNLSLTAAQGILAAGGRTTAQGNLLLDAGMGRIDNTAGTLTAVTTADLRSNGLDSRDGVILANGALTVNAAATHQGNATDINGATLQSTQAGVNLRTGDLQAAGSTLKAGEAVTIAGRAMTLQDSVVFGNTGVAVAGGSIDASRASITSPGDVSVVAGSGALHIANATLLAGRDLTATGNGTGTAAGAQALAGRDLVLGIGTAFDFAAPDLQYQYSRDLTVRAQGISTAGQTVSARNLTLDAGNAALNNAGGTLQATGNVSASGTGLNNTGGTISGVTGATADAGAGLLTNAAGLVTGAQVRIGGAVANVGGVISAGNSLAMTTLALNNDAGVIEAGAGGISINTQGNTLTNTNSGATRGIVSTGAITIASGELNNQAGYIGASGALGISAGNVNNTAAGMLLGLGSLTLNAGSATVDNRNGAIKSGQDANITAGTLDNSGAGSVVFAGRDLTVTAGSIDNSNTKNASYDTGLLATGSATLGAGTVNNTSGAIVSLGNTTVRATAALNNSQGQISGNTVTIDTGALTNTGGRADAQTSLKLRAPQFSADGALASSGSMELTLQGDQTLAGDYAAVGGLTYSTTGAITNLGHLSAGGALSLTGNGINNRANATIDAPQTILTSTGGAINNDGLINSTQGTTTINGALNNTDRVFGDGVTITGAANNTVNAVTGKGAVIASRGGDVNINGALVNTSEALVLSLGNLTVTGDAWNAGSTLNASGNLTINGALTNSNTGLVTGTQSRTEAGGGLFIIPSGSTTAYDAATLAYVGHTGGHWVLPSAAYPFASFGADPKAAVQSCGVTGGDAGDWSCTWSYSTTDAIWAVMRVAAPSAAGLVDPGPAPGGSNCTIYGEASDSRDMSGACGTWWSQRDAYDSAWQQRVTTAYAQLDGAINAFNADLNNRTLIDWFEKTITSRDIVETSVVATKPGQVLAGGNIRIGSGANIDSVIVAGGSIDGGTGQNIATSGTRNTTEQGTLAFNHREYHGGFSDSYSRSVTIQPWPGGATTSSFNLPALQFTPYGAPGTPTSQGTSTPLAGTGASVVGVGAGAGIASLSRGTSGAITGPAGSVGTGGTVTVNLTLAGPLPPSGSANTTTVSLSGATEAPLRGSVITTQVRGSQMQSITALQTSFREQAAIVPSAPQSIATSGIARPPATIRAAGYTTVTAQGAIRLPNNQLFRLNSQPGARYLVETDPAFTNYRTWASSSYMLTQLGMDPERTMKLYGDGFAEQRLVDDQILALTGRRFLTGYSATSDEYQDLLDSGVMFAREFQLTPGVALSAQQMALLTTDIVWLEARTVTLPDGSTTQALVPTVYLRRPVEGDIAPTGALIAGANVTLRMPGQALTNSGTILANGDKAAGDGRLTVDALNVTNTGVLGGGSVTVAAVQTINNAGGATLGTGPGSSVNLNARDIIVRTTTQTTTRDVAGANGISTAVGVNVDRIGTIAADNVTMKALGTINLAGASVSASSNLNITATGGITTEAVATGYAINIPLGGAGGTTQGRTGYYNVSATTQQLTQLSGNNVTVNATGDANFNGTNIAATNNLSVTAKSITIDGVKQSVSIDQQGVNSKGYERVAKADEAIIGGNFTAGNNASLVATAGNIALTGAAVTANTGAATLTATGDVVIHNTTTEHSQLSESYNSSNGFLSSKSTQRDSSTQTTLAEGSAISGATVAIVAGRDVSIQGSGVVSDTQTTISAGRNVSITAATETQTSSSFFEEKKSGFGALGGLSFGTRQQSLDTDQTSTRAVASNVGSLQGNVSISAGQTYTQTGSNVIAPVGDVAITAKKVNITEARETATSESEQKFKQSGISVTVSNPLLTALETTNQMAKQAGNTSDGRMQALALAQSANTLKNAANAIVQDPQNLGGVGINFSLGTQQHESTTTGQSNTSAGSTVAAGGNVSIRALGAGQDSNITVQGSEISAGGIASLRADGKVNLLAAQDTREQHTTNSGSSASIGIGFNYGGATNGITFSAAASSNHGNSDGSEVTNVNTHVTAGSTVSIQSGGDTTLRGAVVSANTVNANVGGKLVIESVQDTATFTDKQSSAGFGVTLCLPPICAGASSATVSSGKSNINSNYQSVTEQSAIRAGDGGFNVSTAGAVDLKGGAITSTQSAVDNGLNRFTPGGPVTVTDIQNSADYSAKGYNITAGYSGAPHDKEGNPVKDDAGNPIGGKPISAPGIGSTGGNAASTTQGAISGIAGNTAARTGDASTGIAPIFNAETVRNDMNAHIAITQAALPGVTQAYAAFANTQERNATTDAERACWAEGGACRVAGHIAIGAIAGGTAGAAGAGVSQAVIPTIGEALKGVNLPDGVKQVLVAGLGEAIGGAVGGTAGAVTGGNATVNNYLTQAQWQSFADQRKACNGNATCERTVDATYTNLSQLQDNALATCDVRGDCARLVKDVNAGRATQQQLVTSGALPDNFVGAANLQLLGQRLAVDPVLREQVTKSITAAYVCETNPAQCTKQAATAAVGLAGVVTGGVLAVSIRGVAAAAGVAIETCLSNVVLCANNVGVTVADILAGEALGGASLSVGGAAGAAAVAGRTTGATGSVATEVNAVWRSATSLTAAEANAMVTNALPSSVVINGMKSVDAANATQVAKGWEAPYIAGTQLVEVTVVQPTQFVRVYVQENGRSTQAGSWIMRAEDVAGLSAQQIASKFSLPQVPTMMTDVAVPAGTRLEVSGASNVMLGANGGGGGVQFQISAPPTDPDAFMQWFTNARVME